MIRLFIYFWRTLNIILPLLPSRWPELLFIEGSLWWRKPGTFQNVLESSEIFYSCSWTYSANLWLREKRRIDVFRRLKKTSSKVRLAKSTIHNDSNESVRTWGGGGNNVSQSTKNYVPRRHWSTDDSKAVYVLCHFTDLRLTDAPQWESEAPCEPSLC